MIRVFFIGIILFSLSLFSQDYSLDDPINTGVNMTVAVLAVDKNISIGDTIMALYMMPIMDEEFHASIELAVDINPVLCGHVLHQYMDNVGSHPDIFDDFRTADYFGNGGFTAWQGERLAIAIWGNDNTSDKKDGFHNSETINFVLFKNNTFYPLEAQYRVGQNIWEPNGIYIIDSLNIILDSKLAWWYKKGFYTE